LETEVVGTIDWDFRYRMMRTHTALHILCGTIWKEFGVQVTGGQMYPRPRAHGLCYGEPE
jgi:misacylated tRNA(Ala) deacylase